MKPTPSQDMALQKILKVLDFEGAPLLKNHHQTLLAHFYSVPYVHRGDGLILRSYFALLLMGVKALDRAETRLTVGSSPVLQAQVKEIKEVLNQLNP